VTTRTRGQDEAAEPIGRAVANRPADRLSFAAGSSLCAGVGTLDRLGPGEKPFAHFRQSIASIAPVEEAVVQLFFERVNVATVVCSVPSCSAAAESVPVRATAKKYRRLF
jgi:hypothetical protein